MIENQIDQTLRYLLASLIFSFDRWNIILNNFLNAANQFFVRVLPNQNKQFFDAWNNLINSINIGDITMDTTEITFEAEKQLHDNLRKCRFCFRMIIDERKAVEISDEIRLHFVAVTQMQVSIITCYQILNTRLIIL